MGDREGRPYGEAGTGGVEPRPYGWVASSAVNGPSGTPAPTEGYKRCGERADVGIGPYGGLQRARGERNPPVTALPCQPPLGKGAKGTGDADCHSQCAHWLRNDTLLEIRYKPGGRAEASAPAEGLQGARKNGRGRTPPLRGVQGVR